MKGGRKRESGPDVKGLDDPVLVRHGTENEATTVDGGWVGEKKMQNETGILPLEQNQSLAPFETEGKKKRDLQKMGKTRLQDPDKVSISK